MNSRLAILIISSDANIGFSSLLFLQSQKITVARLLRCTEEDPLTNLFLARRILLSNGTCNQR